MQLKAGPQVVKEGDNDNPGNGGNSSKDEPGNSGGKDKQFGGGVGGKATSRLKVVAVRTGRATTAAAPRRQAWLRRRRQ